MPRLTCWGIRAALIHLVVGFSLGALILCSKATLACPNVWPWLPLHRELLILGWTAQLALAVAYWILPRLPGGRRGRDASAWAALILLNLGVWLAGAAPALAAPRQAIVMGRTLESLAALAFALHAWPRIKRFGM
jgi:hypothetical protein